MPHLGTRRPRTYAFKLRDLLRPVRSLDVHPPFTLVVLDVQAPRVAADLAILDQGASNVRLDVDLNLLAAVRTGDQELFVHLQTSIDGGRSRRLAEVVVMPRAEHPVPVLARHFLTLSLADGRSQGCGQRDGRRLQSQRVATTIAPRTSHAVGLVLLTVELIESASRCTPETTEP